MSNSLPTTQVMGHTTMQMQKQNMELVHNEVKALGKSGLSEQEKSKKLREQCEGFESIFIQKMWQQMRATLPQENPLVGREEKFWQSMYDTELSKEMAKGGGIGLADMMYDQLSQNLVSASRSTATQAAGSGGIPLERGLNFSGAANTVGAPNLAPSGGALLLPNATGSAAANAPLNLSPNATASGDGDTLSPRQFMPSPLADILAEHKQSAKAPAKDLLADLDALSKANATENTSSKASGTSLYEEVGGAPLTGQVPSTDGVATAMAPMVNATGQVIPGQVMPGQMIAGQGVAQQFLTGLQAKQAANGQYAGQLTGPQRAAQAQFAVNSPPPANGVMPNASERHVVRTTYTTNVPQGQRKANTQRLVQEALRTAQQKVEQEQQRLQQQGQNGQAYFVAPGAVQTGQTYGAPAGQMGQNFSAQGSIQGAPQGVPMTGQPAFQVGATPLPTRPTGPTSPVAPTAPAQPAQSAQTPQPHQAQQAAQRGTPAQMGAHFVAPPTQGNVVSTVVPTPSQEGTQRKS